MYWFRNLAGVAKKHQGARRRAGEQLEVEQLDQRRLPSFLAGLNFDVGLDPGFVTTGDFNGDGLADLAVGKSLAVIVLLNSGGGIFQAPRTVALSTRADSIAVGDFNGDGIQDLATSSGSTDQISVLLGNGNGTFQAPRTFAAGGASRSVAVGDFNGDGIPDLAVSNYNNGNGAVSVLLGNGDGTFQAPRTFAVGSAPWSVAVGDFNGDGVQDLVVADGSNAVSVLLGNGDGSFQPAVQYTAGSGAKSVAIADLNGDGHPDLVVGNALSDFVSVLLGNGDGTFQQARNVIIGRNSPSSVAAGDFNGDGIPDLAVATDSPNEVDVLLGNGDGTFQPPRTFTAGNHPYWVTVGDFNNDGIQDFAVVNTGGDVSVFLGNGDGSFPETPAAAAGTGPQSMAVGDFNGDGIPDLAVADTGDSRQQGDGVSVLLGNGDGSFQAPRAFAPGVYPGGIVAGDFNGDGILDLAVAGPGGVTVLLGNGDGSFQAPRTFAAGTNADSLVIADFNGDGVPDLAVGDGGDPDANGSGVSVLLGNGDGTFQAPLFAPAGINAASIVTADFNGDGVPDIAVVDRGGQYGRGEGLSVLLGNGDGTLQPARALAGGTDPWSMAAGDFNGDGVPDLAVTNYSGVSVLLGNGDGTFQPHGTVTGANSPQEVVTAGDFNSDGILDLAVTGWAGVKILLGNGDGSFQTSNFTYRTGLGPQALVVGDFNSDGAPDLAVAIQYFGEVNILLNDGIWPPVAGGASHLRLPTEDPVRDIMPAGWIRADVAAVQVREPDSPANTPPPNRIAVLSATSSPVPVLSATSSPAATDRRRPARPVLSPADEERGSLLHFDPFRVDPDGPALIPEPVVEPN